MNIKYTNYQDIDTQPYAEAFQEWMIGKVADILQPKEELSVHVTVDISFMDDRMVIVGDVKGLSYRAMEEILSYGIDYDLSGMLHTGLKFSGTFPEDYFDKYLPEEVVDEQEDVEEDDDAENVVNTEEENREKREQERATNKSQEKEKKRGKKDIKENLLLENDEAIDNYASEYHSKFGVTKKKLKSILKQVFKRGVGAFRTNPQSVRPHIKKLGAQAGAIAWGMARVKAFLNKKTTYKTADKDLAKELNESNGNITITVDLINKYFDEFNQEYFDNELVKPPIKLGRKKRVLANVTHLVKPDENGNYTIIDLTFSKFFTMTLEIFKGLLLHEMIHIKMIQDGDVADSYHHGKRFMMYRDILQGVAPFNIPKTEEAEVSMVDTGKSVDVVLYVRTHACGLMVFKEGFMENPAAVMEFEKAFDGMYTHYQKEGKNLFLGVYRVPENMVEGYRTKIKIPKNKALYQCDRALADKIMKEGKLIKEFYK